jgi:hypothetical protein
MKPLAVTIIIMDPAKFPLGQLCMTPTINDMVPYEEMIAAINRHLTGDWGELNKANKVANDRALREGTRLVSAYSTKSGIRFWIITEADRSATTILLPEEY